MVFHEDGQTLKFRVGFGEGEHGAGGGQRPPGPPEVHRAEVPYRTDVSRAEALLMASSDRATSMSFWR